MAPMAVIIAGLLLLFALLVLDTLCRHPKMSYIGSGRSSGLPHSIINARGGRYPLAPGPAHSRHIPPHFGPSPVPSPLAYKDYTVGWICALPIEMAAAKAMLDEVHADLPANPSDENTYILGRICSHNVVVACLPTGIIGPTPAATVATQMLSTFPTIRFNLMVGIGGGVPSQADIRQGDVVVAKPTRDYGGVVQYDYPSTIKECTMNRTGMLSKPPRVLLTALSKLQATHLLAGSRIHSFVSEIEVKYPLLASTLRPQGQDNLFRSAYQPKIPTLTTNTNPKPRDSPQIHYGLIASGNQVIKDSRIRDHLARQSGILCFEMEAAGLLDTFPCLVIRGISDYADYNKNDVYQGYAAATAAAYAKELLSVIPRQQVEEAPLAVKDFSL